MKTQDIKNMGLALLQVLEGKKKLDPVGKADADIDNDGDVDKSDEYLHNRRKAIGKAMKKEGEEVVMNPKKGKRDEKGTETSMEEGVKRPIFKRIMEKRDAHVKGATAPEAIDSKENPGGKKAMADMKAGAKFDDTEEKGHQDAVSAGRAGPSMKARPGDKKDGDKKVINQPEDVTQKGEG